MNPRSNEAMNLRLRLANGCEMNIDVLPHAAPTDVIFVHGNLASNTWWKPTLEHWPASLQGPGRLIMTEWRGCGKSSAPRKAEELHPAALADDLLLALKELHVRMAELVTHSTGGIIGLMALRKAPQLFRRAVFLDPVGARGIQFEDSMFATFDQMRADKKLCATVMAGTIHGCDTQTPLFSQIVDDAFGVAEINWRGVLTQLRQLNATADLQHIPTPVLVLHGEHDAVLPMQDSRDLAAGLPHGEFRELKGQGHSTNIENPRLFTELTTNYLFHS